MCNLCHENVREFYFSLNTAVWEVDLHNWNKWNKTKKYPPLCLMQKVLWWPKAVQNRTVIWDLRNKQENAKRWMSFLLICIIFLLFFLFCFVFFLIHNVVDVLFQWLYLRNYYLLLVWAAQSVFPIVANVPSETMGQEAACWEAPTSGLRLSGRHDTAQPGRCKVWGSCASCPQLRTLPATISFNHCSWHGNPVVVQYKPRAGRQGT